MFKVRNVSLVRCQKDKLVGTLFDNSCSFMLVFFLKLS